MPEIVIKPKREKKLILLNDEGSNVKKRKKKKKGKKKNKRKKYKNKHKNPCISTYQFTTLSMMPKKKENKICRIVKLVGRIISVRLKLAPSTQAIDNTINKLGDALYYKITGSNYNNDKSA